MLCCLFNSTTSRCIHHYFHSKNNRKHYVKKKTKDDFDLSSRIARAQNTQLSELKFRYSKNPTIDIINIYIYIMYENIHDMRISRGVDTRVRLFYIFKLLGNYNVTAWKKKKTRNINTRRTRLRQISIYGAANTVFRSPQMFPYGATTTTEFVVCTLILIIFTVTVFFPPSGYE